jgi:hypothetical protein
VAWEFWMLPSTSNRPESGFSCRAGLEKQFLSTVWQLGVRLDAAFRRKTKSRRQGRRKSFFIRRIGRQFANRNRPRLLIFGAVFKRLS